MRVAARAHQSMIWMRQRAANTLRSLLRESTPANSKRSRRPRRPGRARGAVRRTRRARPPADPGPVLPVLRTAGRDDPSRPRRRRWSPRCAASSCRHARTWCGATRRRVSRGRGAHRPWLPSTAALEEQVRQGFGQHPDVGIYLSQPGLGTFLAPGCAQIGDDPSRYPETARSPEETTPASAPSPRSSPGAEPVRAGPLRPATSDSLTPSTNNPSPRSADRLAFGCYNAATETRSQPPPKPYERSATALSGVLHGCLAHHQTYDEAIAWAQPDPAPAGAPLLDTHGRGRRRSKTGQFRRSKSERFGQSRDSCSALMLGRVSTPRSRSR